MLIAEISSYLELLIYHGKIILFSYLYVLLLQEKKRNNLKDYLNVAGPMGVTHFLILSKTESAPYLRVARTPQGPTLTFKIHEYSLAVDIAQSQLRPRCPKDLFKNPPLVIVFLPLYALVTLKCPKSPCSHFSKGIADLGVWGSRM